MHSLIAKQFSAYAACDCVPDFLMVSIHDNDTLLEGNCFHWVAGPIFIRPIAGYTGPPILIPKECDNNKINAFYRAVKEYKCQTC